jgi:hypothetical protein
MKNKLMPYGLKHEVAKRWPIYDWYKSRKVAQLINPSIADTEIINLIQWGKPALVGRLGGTEARFLGEFQKISSISFLSQMIFRVKPNWIKRSSEVNTLSGFYFKTISEVGSFSDLYMEALADTDILGAWGTAFSSIESKFVSKVPCFVPVGMTAPWIQPYSDEPDSIPWSSALKKKKILVISPFVDSIEKQFANIKNVFPYGNFHDFQLLTLKSPMTLDTKYPVEKTWLQQLNAVKDKMDVINFDVALVSAGSYSFPLAHHAKKVGKIGIHAGGGLQLFFGIMGKRWEKSDYLLKIVNDSWIRPSKDETPDSASLVENGCYW